MIQLRDFILVTKHTNICKKSYLVVSNHDMLLLTYDKQIFSLYNAVILILITELIIYSSCLILKKEVTQH